MAEREEKCSRVRIKSNEKHRSLILPVFLYGCET